MGLMAGGSFAGLLGVACMSKIQGGEPMRDSGESGVHLANMIEALRDRNFISYLGGQTGFAIGTGMLIAFLPLYLSEQLGLASGSVVRLDIVGVVGGALAGLGWGWLADRVGSRPVLMPATGLILAIPLGWLLLPRQMPHIVDWCVALSFVLGVLSNGAAIGAGRLLYNDVVPAGSVTAYMAIYYAWMGLVGGLAPLLAGGILSAAGGRHFRAGQIPVDGYALLFAAALLFLLLGWGLYGRVRRDDVHTTRTVVRNFMNRFTDR